MRCRSSRVLFVCFVILALFGGSLVFAEVYVPYEYEWGIYELDPVAGSVSLIYSSPDKISNIRLSPNGSKFAFSQKFGGKGYEYDEICTINVDGGGFSRLTENLEWDIYPVWSPDSLKIAFLGMNETLGIYTMNADGSNRTLLYDSEHQDSDLHWRGNKIAFTREHQIWIMNSDGTGAHHITDPPRAGEWENAPLPYGDYDPRISPAGESVVFERMMDASFTHGSYDIYMVDITGDNLRNITGNGWTQGMAVWASTGDSLVYTVAAKEDIGYFDIYTINPDGTNRTDLSSALFPPLFLCHAPIYSGDDVKAAFIGEWYDWKTLNTTITCNVIQEESSPKELHIGGEISPAVADVNVKIKIIEPDSTIQTLTATTSIEGEYQIDYTAIQIGEYSFRASWSGDPGHNPSTSSEKTIDIQEPGGIPGYPIEAIVLSLIAFVLVKRIRS